MNGQAGDTGAPGYQSGPHAHHRVRQQGQRVLMVFLAILLMAVGATLQSLGDREAMVSPLRHRVRSVPSPEIVRRTALSFKAVLADVYWIRAVQHYGRTRLAGGGAQDYDLLYPLLDVTTTLDPRFDAAYRLGAVFLAEPPPGGPGRPDLALALLRKGLGNAPERWQYLQDIGFVHYWWLDDVEGAAGWFERAADLPGAPWWLRPLAATTMVEGGDRAGARVLWRQVRTSTDDAWIRGEAIRRLAQLDALDALDRYRHAVDLYRVRTGRPPESWRELVAAGDVSEMPLDPTGVPYELTAPRGDVDVSRRSVLFPLPSGGAFRDRPAR